MANHRTTSNWLSVLLVLLMLTSIGLAPIKSSQELAQQSYIVQGKTAGYAAAQVGRVGGEVTSKLDVINAVGARLNAAEAAALEADASLRLILNAQVEKSGDNGVPATDYAEVTGADKAWAKGVTGAGVTVAVVELGHNQPSCLQRPGISLG